MIVGMMRVRNEARWIRAVVSSILPLCERVLILDDRSEDSTPDICRALGDRVTVIPSPFSGLDESRDKNYLLGEVERTAAEWCLCIDGDEILEPSGPERIRAELVAPGHDCYALRVLYLWNAPDTVRLDGVYGRFRRPSLFRLGSGARFQATGCGGQFHCGNVPSGMSSTGSLEVRLFHLGYLCRSDRIAKYRWYTEADPDNEVEDCYRHMVQGDLPEVPPHLRLKHAGPLKLGRLA